MFGKNIRTILILILVLSFVFVLPLFAAQEKSSLVMREGTVTAIKGVAMIKKQGSSNWEDVKVGMMLSQGDRIKTAAGAELDLNLDGKAQSAIIKVRESTEIGLVALSKDKINEQEKTLLELSVGEVLIKAKKLQKGSDFEVKTPTSIVGVRGTIFSVRVRSIK